MKSAVKQVPPANPLAKAHRYPLCKAQGGPQNLSEHGDKEKSRDRDPVFVHIAENHHTD